MHVGITESCTIFLPCLYAVQSETVYKQIANSQLAVLPNTAHSLDTVDCEGIAHHISRFMRV